MARRARERRSPNGFADPALIHPFGHEQLPLATPFRPSPDRRRRRSVARVQARIAVQAFERPPAAASRRSPVVRGSRATLHRLQRTAGNAATAALVQGHSNSPRPTVQRATVPPQFSGLEQEVTFERKTKWGTVRLQFELLYNPASGPVKLSKGIGKTTWAKGKGTKSAVTGRLATLDPLSKSLADDLAERLGLDPRRSGTTSGWRSNFWRSAPRRATRSR